MSLGMAFLSNPIYALSGSTNTHEETVGINEETPTNPEPGYIPENITEITLIKAGTLRDILGDRIHSVGALSISGPINNQDFRVLWEASFYGDLKYLDLAKAMITDNIIPVSAFYDGSVQYVYDEKTNTRTTTPTKLEKVILPEGVVEIGDRAFQSAEALKDINLPSSLIRLGDCAFRKCFNLSITPLILPENIVSFENAFLGCRSLTEVELPENLSFIDVGAFGGCPISKINITDRIKNIGGWAFEESHLTEVVLADDCDINVSFGTFFHSKYLSKLHIPDQTQSIQDYFCEGCTSLTQVNMPGNLCSIGEGAFDGSPLQEIEFPSSLKLIFPHAFRGAKFTKLILPASLEEVMGGAFGECCNLKEVICLASIPPHCTQLHEITPNPFTGCSPDLVIYVPKGSGELYRNARGWGENQNIVEKDMSGVEMINPFSGGGRLFCST